MCAAGGCWQAKAARLPQQVPRSQALLLDQAVPHNKLSRDLFLPQHTAGNPVAGMSGHVATHWRGPKASHSEGHLLQRRRKSIPDTGMGTCHGDTHLSSHLICTQPGLRRNDQGWNHFSTVCRLEHSTSSHKCSTCSLQQWGRGLLLSCSEGKKPHPSGTIYFQPKL